jgi:excisionase family DNA binding protein
MPADARMAAALATLDAAREVLAAVLDDEGHDCNVPPSPRLALKFDEAAQELGASRTAVFEAVKRGDLVAVEIPGAGRRIRRCDLEAYVAGLAAVVKK